MKTMKFSDAADNALAQAMSKDPRIIVMGEDIHMIRLNLYSRFGKERVRSTPISESAFVGAAVGAAMAGLKPVVEVMLVDFTAVAMDALLNHAAKTSFFSGGRWQVPMVVRTACGGGYGDGGQHEQSLWGWLAHIPGLTVVVPSTPADAGGLMLASLEHNGPVLFMEHKLLSDVWLDFLGSGGRKTVHYDVPVKGALGPVPKKWQPVPLGKALVRCTGRDLTIVSAGVGVHRSLEAAQELDKRGISATVLDLRSIQPLDKKAICGEVSHSKRLLVVDEDYREFGLSGEVAAVALEAGIEFRYARVCTETTIPYARDDEDRALPHVSRIIDAAISLF